MKWKTFWQWVVATIIIFILLALSGLFHHQDSATEPIPVESPQIEINTEVN